MTTALITAGDQYSTLLVSLQLCSHSFGSLPVSGLSIGLCALQLIITGSLFYLRSLASLPVAVMLKGLRVLQLKITRFIVSPTVWCLTPGVWTVDRCVWSGLGSNLVPGCTRLSVRTSQNIGQGTGVY